MRFSFVGFCSDTCPLLSSDNNWLTDYACRCFKVFICVIFFLFIFAAICWSVYVLVLAVVDPMQ